MANNRVEPIEINDESSVIGDIPQNPQSEITGMYVPCTFT